MGIKKAISWFDDRLPIFSFLNHELNEHPYPKNLNYMWNFGSLAGVALMLQIVTGIILAMHYKPDTALAFDSIQHIMRDVEWGWLIRNLHMVGASFFFVVVYIHIGRGMYYGSYKSPREVLWWMGIVIFFLMMATAFMGYVLPWGQMSYWGATVITNLLTVIPFVGDELVMWIWGGYSVNDATLNRFFSLHYLLPFVICGFVFLHLWALHNKKTLSNNPTGIDLKDKKDFISFHPYYTIKDTFGLAIYLIPFTLFVFYFPESLGHPDNYIPADPMTTPAHIVPEWYFLPFYAILRAIPIKELGVLAMFASIAVLFILPWLDQCKVRSARFRPTYRAMFWIFIASLFTLGWVGANAPDAVAFTVNLLDGKIHHEATFTCVGRIATAVYFGFFLLLPWISKREKTKPIPTSI